MQPEYKPIDCDFHDRIEEYAVVKKPCEIVYRDEQAQKHTARDVITDVFTENHEEFLRLQSGPKIRLDHVVSIDGRLA